MSGGFLRRFRRRIGRGALILMYHRISAERPDPWSLNVSPTNFAAQMDALRKIARPVPLDRLAACVRDSALPRTAVAVTFDDGYADNLTEARPVLERFDIPATLFVAAGYLGLGREFWWDELERLLLRTPRLPATLRLAVAGEPLEFTGIQSSSSKQALYQSLWQRMQPLQEEERLRVLAELRLWAGTAVAPVYPILTNNQLFAIADGGLVEIGAHTMTHPLLTAMPLTVQHREITQSRIVLERLLGRRISAFSYPYGARMDETVSAVREAGFTHACTTQSTRVSRESDVFALPRVQVEDWDGGEFARRIEGWLFPQAPVA